ncbi:hypothetical protein FD733_16700 [Pantoea sp. Eser]|nr:hypothetical protein [Pantoea sp. Eser]
MFSKIIISGDILRPFPGDAFYQSATKKNIRWLHALLKYPLQQCNMQVSTLAWDEDLGCNNNFFDTPELYQQMGMPLNCDSWARIVSSDDVPEALLEKLREQVNQALVIGYEMPAVITNALKMLGTPFIDILLHPLRFYLTWYFRFVLTLHITVKNLKVSPSTLN